MWLCSHVRLCRLYIFVASVRFWKSVAWRLVALSVACNLEPPRTHPPPHRLPSNLSSLWPLKMPPRCFLMPPRCLQMPPRCFQVELRCLQNASKPLYVGSTWPQDTQSGFQKLLGRLTMASRGPWDGLLLQPRLHFCHLGPCGLVCLKKRAR